MSNQSSSVLRSTKPSTYTDTKRSDVPDRPTYSYNCLNPWLLQKQDYLQAFYGQKLSDPQQQYQLPPVLYLFNSQEVNSVIFHYSITPSFQEFPNIKFSLHFKA